MKQNWEYLIFSRKAGVWSDDRYDGRDPTEKLTEAGKDGWELVSVCYDGAGYNFYLKRLAPVKKRTTRKKSAAK